jgi:hypothetical protein
VLLAMVLIDLYLFYRPRWTPENRPVGTGQNRPVGTGTPSVRVLYRITPLPRKRPTAGARLT